VRNYCDNNLLKRYPWKFIGAESKMKVLPFFVLCFASVGLADDFKTVNGKEYKNVTIARVEPDGIVLITNAGISKVYFSELPKDVQERFHYEPEKAAAYATQQRDAYVTSQTAATAADESKKAVAAHQQAQAATQQARRDTVSALTAHLEELQQEENNLLVRIGQAERAQRDARYTRKRSPYYSDPLEQQLPLLRTHLDDVRRDKKDTRRQLERVEHK
jgi:hypothetical protein